MEKLEEVLEQFDLNVIRCFKGRQMMLYETEKQVYALMEYWGSESRLKQEVEIKQYLMEHGFNKVDQYIVNSEGEYIVEDRYHTPFVMKKYYLGRECDIYKEYDVYLAAENLARLHIASYGVEETFSKKMGRLSTRQHFEKRNLEMKRVRNYMSHLKRKGDFELTYNQNYEGFKEEAELACCQLGKIEEKENELHFGFCHGAYQHHSVIKLRDGVATVGFEQYTFGYQLWDLYSFLRKVLEKNGYQFRVCEKVLAGYGKIRPLRHIDYCYLYVMLLYPEKFWKISNHYFNTKKTWVPPKTVEKLKKVVQQNLEKQKFLVKFREDYVEKGLNVCKR